MFMNAASCHILKTAFHRAPTPASSSHNLPTASSEIIPGSLGMLEVSHLGLANANILNSTERGGKGSSHGLESVRFCRNRWGKGLDPQ